MKTDEHQDDNFASQEQETNAQQFSNNDVLEVIIKLLLFSFPFMRNNLKAMNRFFRTTVDREPFLVIYIPELPAEPTTISMRSIIKLKGIRSGAVIRLTEIINSPKWHVAWLKLRHQSYGWFAITDVHWKRKVYQELIYHAVVLVAGRHTVKLIRCCVHESDNCDVVFCKFGHAM